MGFNLMDGGPNLLDLRLADDIVIFAQSRLETGNLLDALVKQLDRVGLLLNPLTSPDQCNHSWSDSQSLPRDAEQKSC